MPRSDALVVDHLTVRFGGLTAVNDVTLEAPLGRLTGLIGPNGAGKTTTFNACTGLVKPTSGTVSLLGDDISGLAPQARAQRGLGRTFQRMELFDSLTVADNIALGKEAGLAGSMPWRQLIATSRERTAIDEAAAEAMQRCGIEALASRRPNELPTGQRRLVELARVLAGDFRILLLDEPSSGLDRVETERFGAVLRNVVDGGHGILIVEHDMALVMTVCDQLYVLDFGELIFEGTTTETAMSDVVRAAYLGTEPVEVPG